ASHRTRLHPKPISDLLQRPQNAVPSDQHLLRPSAKLAKRPVEIDALNEVVAHPRIRTPKMLALATLIADEAIADPRQRAPRKVPFAEPLHVPEGELIFRHRLRRHMRPPHLAFPTRRSSSYPKLSRYPHSCPTVPMLTKPHPLGPWRGRPGQALGPCGCCIQNRGRSHTHIRGRRGSLCTAPAPLPFPTPRPPPKPR